MNQFPPRSPHVTVPKLLDFFARTVDPNLILSIYIGKMDAVRQVVPVYVAMKTSESANQLSELSLFHYPPLLEGLIDIVNFSECSQRR